MRYKERVLFILVSISFLTGTLSGTASSAILINSCVDV